ncbi:hypothetical protein [Thermococcus sp.]|uniref:hypothetical protein n=1 Tax=Thermococcus sp. TaxID=35749 RepID=UPI0025EBA1C2|nr:hypothetical protein [Thermococcus sp.]
MLLIKGVGGGVVLPKVAEIEGISSGSIIGKVVMSYPHALAFKTDGNTVRSFPHAVAFSVNGKTIRSFPHVNTFGLALEVS